MFDAGDEALIESLAKDLTVSQLADKWDCTYRQMYNYTYRLGIDCANRNGRGKARCRNKNLITTMKNVVADYSAGMKIVDIALKYGKVEWQIYKYLKESGVKVIELRRAEMIQKASVLINSKDKFNHALLMYGWSKEKSKYWIRQAKKAAL